MRFVLGKTVVPINSDRSTTMERRHDGWASRAVPRLERISMSTGFGSNVEFVQLVGHAVGTALQLPDLGQRAAHPL
jgi:hypothetical protein